MSRPLWPLKKLPDLLNNIRISLDKNKFEGINLYFQDESRFGLMTHIGRCLTARGVKPIVGYQHAFKNTYLYGSFSPLDGDSFVYEIEGTTSEIFHQYLVEFSKHRPKELKLVIIDNAGFHSMKNYQLPDNIELVRIPPYTPELNPAEKVWQYIKHSYKNKVFKNLDNVKKWINQFVRENLDHTSVMSITHNKFYIDNFKAHCYL